MVTSNWFYDAMLYVYALSLLFYFSDFVDANRSAKRIGTGLLVFVWTLQTGYLVYRLVSHLDISYISGFEYWFVFSWLLVTVSLVISRFFRIEYIVFIVNLIGFAVLTALLLVNPGPSLSTEPFEAARDLLIVHISLMTCAFAALTFSAIFAGMYMFLHRKLKKKRWTSPVRRLPSLQLIDLYSFRLVSAGAPLLAMSLSVAIVSIAVEREWAYLLDWKVIISLAALVMYVVYLVRRKVKGQIGFAAARLNLWSFGTLILNVLLNPISHFH
ncbi:cytochrome C assembly family protein [Paenibacillus sp. MMS18-CY102]|uniref:cytochrome C assembly family protein n=1 Tax=Paenibacillus sp. MMS18-CY102 TaxID=2682849 RepID=UPI0013655D59|nr:cytochrome c biogenesis protein CcsA [Paenibacillus sp. MMS18-CY102]MWC28729.1 cytochrome C assembly protein [Paenibacillus sp. MMS18-CY102]